jgi:hypothetical protein
MVTVTGCTCWPLRVCGHADLRDFVLSQLSIAPRRVDVEGSQQAIHAQVRYISHSSKSDARAFSARLCFGNLTNKDWCFCSEKKTSSNCMSLMLKLRREDRAGMPNPFGQIPTLVDGGNIEVRHRQRHEKHVHTKACRNPEHTHVSTPAHTVNTTHAFCKAL